MAASVDVVIAGESVQLLGGRALYRPLKSQLLIADLHLGKGDVFRRAGIALPRGGTSHDLARLGALIEASGARSVLVLGDVLHGPANDTHWRHSYEDWRARHAGVEIGALLGNHDRALTRAGLAITLHGTGVDDGPFALRHDCDPVPGLHVICGHLHPVVSLPGILRKRWPVFWLRRDITVLPAFSAFTGGFVIDVGEGERAGVCVEDGIAMIAGPDAGHAPPRRFRSRRA